MPQLNIFATNAVIDALAATDAFPSVHMAVAKELGVSPELMKTGVLRISSFLHGTEADQSAVAGGGMLEVQVLCYKGRTEEQLRAANRQILQILTNALDSAKTMATCVVYVIEMEANTAAVRRPARTNEPKAINEHGADKSDRVDSGAKPRHRRWFHAPRGRDATRMR